MEDLIDDVEMSVVRMVREELTERLLRCRSDDWLYLVLTLTAWFSSDGTRHLQVKHTMPKNKGKGGKNRRRGARTAAPRELAQKVEGQDYAQVTRMLGNGHLHAMCSDSKERMCVIPGSMRKKQWVGQGDIILINLRDYQDDKADIVLRYTPSEVRSLKKLGELPSNMQFDENQEDEDDRFEFAAGEEGSDVEDEADGAKIMAQPSHVGMLPPSDDDEVDLEDL